MKIGYWLLFFWLLGNGSLSAQRLTARNLSLQQGLPEYFVSGIVQDKAGFIWLATRDGLARYDGRQFKVFRHQPTGRPSLASNVILSIQAISDSALLIHLENNTFQLFDPITEQFSRLLTDKQLQQKQIRLVKASVTSDEKALWGRFSTQLMRYDRKTGQFTTYPFPPFPDPGGFLGTSLVLAKHHQLFTPFPGRLLQFDTQTGLFQSWEHAQVGLPGTIDNFYGIPVLERDNGDILIGAARQLLAFNPQTHRFRSIPIPSPLDTRVGPLYQTPDGQVYFTYGMSVYRLTSDDRITPIWTAPRIDYQNYFQALLLDRSGVLWIGTNGDGIYQIDQRALPIKTYPYRTNFFCDVLETEVGLDVPPWAKTDRQLYYLRTDGTVPYMTCEVNGYFELLRGDRQRHLFRTILQFPQTQRKKGVEGGNALR